MIDLYGKADFPDEKIVFEREMMGEFEENLGIVVLMRLLGKFKTTDI